MPDPDDGELQAVETPASAAPQFGDRTATALLALLQDFYRQEIGAEEDVFRSLPFFAASLGALVALLNYSAAQLPTWPQVARACGSGSAAARDGPAIACVWPVGLVALCLIAVVGLSVAALWFLFLAIRQREYRRVGPESAIVARARALHAYHAEAGVQADGLDALVVADLRDQLLEPFADALAKNRAVNSARYRDRARAVICLLLSLLFALLATTLLAMWTKSETLPASTVSASPPRRQEEARPAVTKPAAHGPKPSGNLIYTITKGAGSLPLLKK